MNKAVFMVVVFLTVSIPQIFGQATSAQPMPPIGVPATAKRIFLEDFGTGSTSNAATSPFTTNGLTFAPSTNIPGDAHYSLSKSTLNTTASSYGVWWGNKNHTGQWYEDAIDPGNGYMMVINSTYDITQQYFTYTITNLCPNSHLYFSFYAGNLVYGGTGDDLPSIRLELTDPEDPSFIVQYSTGDIAEAAHPTWNPYSFDFYTTNQGSLILSIYNNTGTSKKNAGNDLVLDDIAVWVDIPPVTVSGPTSYCAGDKMNLTASYNDVNKTYGDSPTILWLDSCSTSGCKWTSTGITGSNYTGVVQNGYYYEAVVGSSNNITTDAGLTQTDNQIYNDNCCSVSAPIQVSIPPSNSTLYWKPNATNQNWNDASNWQDVNGNSVDYYPTECVDVHIPGEANMYPTLDYDNNSCSCHDIWFHFGSGIGKPHLLNYHYAYVQYNFGLADDGSKNGDIIINGDSYSTTPMNRGQWYALAAPLQKIASGDFCVGGYPNFWQQSFHTSPQVATGIAQNALDANWFTPDSTNAWNIQNQYNAIAIWAGDHVSSDYGEGADYQTNLDNLNGIIEVPYFENQSIIPWHRLFSHSNGISYFQWYYYNLPGLDAVPASVKPFGTIAREAPDAYRFIFEDPTHFSKTVVGTDNVYSMLNVPDDGSEIMVGNPFMSNLDFNAFALENEISSYRLYVDNNFTAYSNEAGAADDKYNMQYIAPLQAFFITPSTSSNGTLAFDADKIALAAPPDNKLKSSSSNGNMKPDVLYLKAESPAGKSYLTLSMQNVNEKNLILLLPDGYPNVPQLYATDVTGQKNAIQFEGGYVEEIPFGIISSDSTSEVTLTVFNQDQVSAGNLVLHDNLLGKDIDLKSTDSYTFVNVPNTPDRFVLKMSNVVTGITPAAVEAPVRAFVSGNTLQVSAGSKIAEVSVITLQGITLSKDTNIGQISYTKTLNFQKGIYLVSVKLETGETKVLKVMKLN